MEMQSGRTLKYRENDGTNNNMLASAITLKTIIENCTLKCIAARLRVKMIFIYLCCVWYGTRQYPTYTSNRWKGWRAYKLEYRVELWTRCVLINPMTEKLLSCMKMCTFSTCVIINSIRGRASVTMEFPTPMGCESHAGLVVYGFIPLLGYKHRIINNLNLTSPTFIVSSSH